ncbi:DUF7693 family protein [Pseudomonas umsongensis]|uniref:DUF7693 family protein n=1 Tax=Pseudomonas umsongensis TaxID=198618 RepID=UPI00200A145E|nr:hypothetical protein [Pseudomonas umsongensis]MCK8686724.1 hypothetical protein [Pseudomonas umsongensis]
MLTARKVFQILRDASTASRPMQRITKATWGEIYCGLMTVDVDGWTITFFIDCGDLDYCDSCVSADGRRYDFSAKDDFDPVGLLSPDEHLQLEDWLRHV